VTLFAFAGAYLWTTLPLVAAAILLVWVVRPPIARPPRILDAALAACLLVVALQLLPLPPKLRLALSPRVGILDQALWVGAPSDPQNGPASPLSVDVAATRIALALAVAFVCVFWSTRETVARGGVRTVSRGIAWTGLALAAVTLAQRATAATRLYWYFPTVFGAPFGPYRNRNDFATWLIMAIPATAGYIAARAESRRTDRGHAVPFASLVDADAVWFAGSVSLMSAALLASLSRSGLMGAVAALASFLWLSRSRVGHAGRLRLLVSGGLVLAMALTYVQAGALTGRLDETLGGNRRPTGDLAGNVGDDAGLSDCRYRSRRVWARHAGLPADPKRISLQPGTRRVSPARRRRRLAARSARPARAHLRRLADRESSPCRPHADLLDSRRRGQRPRRRRDPERLGQRPADAGKRRPVRDPRRRRASRLRAQSVGD
jgi:hypothetical protein